MSLYFIKIYVGRVQDVVAGMDKTRGSRGARELSEEVYSHTLQQKFNQAIGGTPEWADLHQPDKEQDMEEGGLVKVRVGNKF